MRVAVRRLLPAVLAVLALTSTSCGGGGSDDAGAPSEGRATPTEPAAASASAGGDAQQAGEPEALPAAGDLANFSCTQRSGGVWSARGDISNSTSEPMVYSVTVATVDGADVSGEDTEDFLLKPDESTSFDLPGISRGPADACMPRLVRAPR